MPTAAQYIVSLRRRGRRVALGALKRDRALLAKVLNTSASRASSGLRYQCTSRFLSSMLYGVSPSDPLTFASVIGIVLLVATAAALVPAIRASRIDPMTALREE
jgi:ABC-type antimicrobial peptide transport system permease subunit